MNNPDSAISDYQRRRQAQAEIQAEINEGNKRAVFDALAAAHITEVHVDFDGEGDSGQINSVFALRGNDRAELPTTTVTIRQSSWHDPQAVTAETTPEEAIETLCYAYLEEEHGGWENDGGGYGEFRFDVAGRTIQMEFNGRITDTYTDNHTF